MQRRAFGSWGAAAASSFGPNLAGRAERPGQILLVAPQGGDFTDIRSAVNSIGDASASKPYVILLAPGVYASDGVHGRQGAGIDLRGDAGTNDYVSLVGLDRLGCVIARSNGDSFLAPAIQACDHGRIANLTLSSNETRIVHWDSDAPGATLICEGVTFHSEPGHGQVGLSTGMNGGGLLIVSGCLFDNTIFSVHGGRAVTDTSAKIVLQNSQFLQNTTYGGVDMGSAQHDTEWWTFGCARPFDPGNGNFGMRVIMPRDSKRNLLIYTDGTPGFFYADDDVSRRTLWNSLLFPQTAHYAGHGPLREGNVAVFDFDLGGFRPASGQGERFPAVVSKQGEIPGQDKLTTRIVQGPVASVMMVPEAGVTPGDTLVTSAAAGLAIVDNSQQDLTRVLGWAASGKAAGEVGRVNVRLNKLLHF